MVSFQLPLSDDHIMNHSQQQQQQQQSPQRKRGTEDSEHPTEEETDIEEQEQDETSIVVEENTTETKNYNFQNNKCCAFWIVSFVLIMIFSRHVVHAFFRDKEYD